MLGLCGAWVATPQISSILYDVKPRELTVLVVAAVSTFSVTSLAALIPSVRAARLSPASVLRDE